MRQAPERRPGMSFPPTTRRMLGLIVSRIVLDTLEELKMALPENERKAPSRIAVDPQAAREVRFCAQWR